MLLRSEAGKPASTRSFRHATCSRSGSGSLRAICPIASCATSVVRTKIASANGIFSPPSSSMKPWLQAVMRLLTKVGLGLVDILQNEHGGGIIPH